MSPRRSVKQTNDSTLRPSQIDEVRRPATTGWRGVLTVGAAAALGSVALIVVQVAVFAVSPPPEDAAGVVTLLQSNPVLGLVSLDALYLVNNILVALLYLALTVALYARARSLATIALTLGLLGMAAYFGSNPSLELLTLADQAREASVSHRAALMIEADALLAAWRGTAFLTYYFLGAAALLLFATAMLRTGQFSRATGTAALAAGVLMLVPSTFGLVGMVFSLLSLVPWSVMCVLAARRLLALARASTTFTT